MKLKILLALFLSFPMVFSGCGTGADPDQDVKDNELVMPTIEPTQTDILAIVPTVITEATGLSGQSYVSQSGAFKITLPEAWNCSETGVFQVNCQAPEQSAELQADITSTGYELDQQAFLSFSHAELVNAYSEVKEYAEVERIEDEGQLRIISTWRIGDIYWQGTDIFQRTSGTIFHLNTSERKDLSEKFALLFAEMSKSIEIIPTVLQSADLYAGRTTYTAPQSFFNLEIPTAWEKYVFSIPLEHTIAESILSPDKRAAIQVTVYSRGAFIEQTLKGEKTLEIIRAQNGYDLRVSDDRALPDGREKLVWSANRKGVKGISFFDSYGSSLYVLSIVWEDSTEYLYQPLLEELTETFTRE